MHHLKSLLGSEMCWLKGWSGCGAAGLPKAYTLAIPQEAAAPVEFTLPPLPAVQLPDKDLINKPLHHYSKKKDGPLVIYAPIFDGLSSNSVTSTISNVVTRMTTPSSSPADLLLPAAQPMQDQAQAAVHPAVPSAAPLQIPCGPALEDIALGTCLRQSKASI